MTMPLGDAVTATLIALPVEASIMPTVAGVGPRTVSQLRVSGLGEATSDEVLVTVSVAVTVRAVPVAGVNVSVTC